MSVNLKTNPGSRQVFLGFLVKTASP